MLIVPGHGVQEIRVPHLWYGELFHPCAGDQSSTAVVKQVVSSMCRRSEFHSCGMVSCFIPPETSLCHMLQILYFFGISSHGKDYVIDHHYFPHCYGHNCHSGQPLKKL